MKFVYKLAFISLVCAFLAGTSAAQTAPSDKKALINELITVTGGDKAAIDIFDSMMTAMDVESAKMVDEMIESDSSLSALDKEILKTEARDTTMRISKKLKDFMTKELNFEAMILEVSIPLYEKHFTEGELRDLIAFYRTPTGKKTVEVLPKLMMDSMVAFSEKLTPKLTKFIKETTDAEIAAMKGRIEKKLPK